MPIPLTLALPERLAARAEQWATQWPAMSVAQQEEARDAFRAYCGASTDANWCAAFLSYCLHQATDFHAPFKSAGARQWAARALKHGWRDVPTKDVGGGLRALHSVEVGDVLVFWRVAPDSWEGHIGTVVDYAAASGIVTTVEGNTGGSRGLRHVKWHKYGDAGIPRLLHQLRPPK